MSRDALAALVSSREVLAAELARRDASRFAQTFPDAGPYARTHYPKHLAFLAAGAQHRERLFLAANRVGKTMLGAYEITAHLTGLYPAWWEGRRFACPVQVWAAGDTSKTVRDIIQPQVIGEPGQMGQGMIPAHLILSTTSKSGVPNAVEDVYVRHASGGMSVLQLKSYDQRREAFQGTSRHVVWLDEEPPEDVYTECLLRTAETSTHPGGVVICTFTPLMGLTPLILSFLPKGRME